MTLDELVTACRGDTELARTVGELIRAEHDRLVELLEEMPAFVSVVEGPEFEVVLVNRMIRESPPGSSLGKKAADIYPGDNPLRRVLERVYATGIAETVHDLPTYYADGRDAGRYFTRSFVPLRDAPGNRKRILVMVYEVTETVRARHSIQAEQQRLYALLEEAPLPIGVMEGPSLRLVMLNRRTRENLAGSAPLGTSLSELVPPENPTLVAALRVYETGVAETIETTARDFAAHVGRRYSVTLVPIRDAEGTVRQVMSAAVEITEHYHAREALEAQARALELARRTAVEAGQAKDQFLAMLGHELRNPLSPMVTALHVMRLEGTSSPALDILERQVRHLTRLVDDLLDVSRITRGVVALNRKPLELATVVNRALEMSSPALEERGHQVVTSIVDGSLAVSGDPDRLAQVVSNLITNAAKYSERGSEIRIGVQRDGDRARLSVADNGVGIAPEMLVSVFDVFVQQPQTLDRSHGGLGLGLAIVKSIVEAHDGVVSVHSDGLGHGSTFVVDLPTIVMQGATSDAEIRDAMAAGVDSRPATPVRILVVDDNRDAANSLQVALEASGHVVAIAYDGPSALEIAVKHEPELALVDIGLPVMDGYRLAELLRASYEIPVVAITGYGQEADRRRTAAAGFAAHLTKPVNFDELGALVERLASHDRSRPRKAPLG